MTEQDDEKTFQEFMELGQAERSQDEARSGPALKLLQRIHQTKRVPCGCGHPLQLSSLLEVGVVGAARCSVGCEVCEAKLDKVFAVAVCVHCEFGLCSVCLLKYQD